MMRLYDTAFTWLERLVEANYGGGQFHLKTPTAPAWILRMGRWLCGKGSHDWRSKFCKWCGESNQRRL